MRLEEGLLRQFSDDLGLNIPFIKGQTIQVRNCWHFSTDGNAIDAIFLDDDDFIAGMNRIYVVSKNYIIVILAFSLMDNHVHFVIYGSFDESNRFMHEYLRRTSIYLMSRHGLSNKMQDVPISHQPVTDDLYLKTVICYTIKNAPNAGLHFNSLDYPWSSGPLYFRQAGIWSSPAWMNGTSILEGNILVKRDYLKSRNVPKGPIRTIGNLVFPGEYVAYEIVEQIFKSHRGFNYFLCRSKDSDVDSKGGYLSLLSVPIQEIRQHKKELCMELFGAKDLTTLDTAKRLRIARTLYSRYNSSPKQIAKICGLIYSEVQNCF